MRRTAHLALALIAATLHLFAPVAVYAMGSVPSIPNDLCSAVRSATVRSAALPPAPAGAPTPSSNEHHCAHAPCCAGGTLDASAPPPILRGLATIALAGLSVPAIGAIRAPIAPIVAAQPRGPPPLS
jgi:hypothetical protein